MVNKMWKNNNKYSEIQNYSDLLKQTRMNHNMKLNEVARELRVREDILEAIENGDFSKIPPQGYSRNMIKSYARLLGLDANKITNMFLESEYSFQISKQRQSYQKITDENRRRTPNIVNNNSIRTPREQIENKKGYNNLSNTASFHATKNRKVHNMRNSYTNTPRYRTENNDTLSVKTNRNSYSHNEKFLKNDLFNGDDYDSAHKRLYARMNANSNKQTESGFSSQNNTFLKTKRSFNKRQLIDRQQAHTLTNSENPNYINNKDVTNKSSYRFINLYNSNSNNKKVPQFKLKIPIIAIIVVILLLILVLSLFFLGKQNESNKSDVSNISVTGLTDPEINNNTNNNEQQQNNTTKMEEPKDVEFTFKVKEGKTCYMEIYENNSNTPILARTVKGGETNSFKVTGSLKVITTSPSSVELTLAGNVVEPKDTNKTGVYVYTVNFTDYLEQWKKTNGQTSTNTQSTSTNNTTTNNSTNSVSNNSASNTNNTQNKKKTN